MESFFKGWRAFKAGLDAKHIRDYWSAVWNHAWEIWWGAGLIGLICTALTLYYAPSRWILGWVVAWVFLVAGYYTWRPYQLRLTPKFRVSDLRVQPTPTESPGTTRMYVQVTPECVTDAPVYECRGRLLLVSTFNPARQDWVPTEMNAPLNLGWDYYGYDQLTIEPGIGQRLDVCYWDNHATAVVPTVQPLPSKWRSIIGPGPFKFDIRMTAKDSPPVDFSVTVDLLGRKWDKPEVELIQNRETGR